MLISPSTSLLFHEVKKVTEFFMDDPQNAHVL